MTTDTNGFFGHILKYFMQFICNASFMSVEMENSTKIIRLHLLKGEIEWGFSN